MKKELLAKLLANENITVVSQDVETASFDVKRRVLTMPIWKNDMHVDTEDNYNKIRSNLINNNIYLPDLNRETYGIINSENIVDIRINISLLNQPIEEIYKHFMNASA